MNNIKHKALESIKWNLIAVVVKPIFQILFMIILTRLLNPEDFGLFAIGMIIISFGTMFSDFGFASALVQKKNITENDIRFVFTLQVVLSIIFTILIYSSSTYIAEFFDKKQAEDMIKVLSCIFIIQSLGLTSTSLLKREMNFKPLQLITLISYFIGYLFVGLPLAYFSYGIWSLVFLYMSQVFLKTIMILIIKRHSFKPLFKHSNGRFFLTFGTKTLSNNIVNLTFDSIPNILIGRFFGTENLGFFDRARTLAKMPMDTLTVSFQSILFPLYSRIQNNYKQLKIIYLGGTRLLSLLLFPIFFTVALIPNTVILALFGSKWDASIDILVPLALAMPMNALMALGGPVLWGNNEGGQEVKAQFISLIILLLIIMALSQTSLVVVSWGIFIALLFRLYFINKVVLRFMQLSWVEYFITLSKPLILGSVISILIFMLNNFLITYLHSMVLILIIDFIFAALLWIFFMFKFILYFLDENLLWLVERNKDKLPNYILKKMEINDE